MKKINVYLFLFLFVAVGCGTDTGNPTYTNTTPVSSTSPYMDWIAYNMCNKIRTCFTPVLANCETKIRTATLIPLNLGLNETTYPNFNVIQSAIDSTTLHTDTAKRDLCLQSITSASCASTEVQQSYNSSSVEDLNQAWKLLTIDSNCSQFIY